MIAIYSVGQNSFFLQDGAIASDSLERSFGDAPAVSVMINLEDDFMVNATIRSSGSDWTLLLTLMQSPSNFVQGETMELHFDSHDQMMMTDELGGVEFHLPREFDDALVTWPAKNNRVVLELSSVVLTGNDLAPLLIEKSPAGNFVVIPELAVQLPFDGTSNGFQNVLEGILDHLVTDERGQTITARKMLKQLNKLGFEVQVGRGKGSHQIVKTPEGKTVPIPFHKSDMPKGTFHTILKQLGVSYDELVSA